MFLFYFVETSPSIAAPSDPCVPSPCGSYAECRDNNGLASCSCLPSYVGSPPYCKPECVVHSDCPSDRACEAEKCRNPCDGSCGLYANCFVNNHVPVCLCPEGFTGDPFRQCSPKPVTGKFFLNFTYVFKLVDEFFNSLKDDEFI